MRAEAVADGQLVEIPVPLAIRTVVTQEDRGTGERENPGKGVGVVPGKTGI